MGWSAKRSIVVGVVLLLVVAAVPAQGVSVSLTPSSQNVQPGSTLHCGRLGHRADQSGA